TRFSRDWSSDVCSSDLNGTQLECVNCTACIDACDAMMEAVNLPKGLIRYASEDEISKNKKFVFTARMKGYLAVLLILCGVLTGRSEERRVGKECRSRRS